MPKKSSGCGPLLVLIGGLVVLSKLTEFLGEGTWQETYAVVGIAGVVCAVFVLTHLRALSEGELIQLATKRRNKQIRAYFTFHTGQLVVAPELKKRMVSTGTFCSAPL